ncbi:MAG: precorrin-4 C(11)-methyltransferase [Eubacterium sp.]|nr:precorrin-4 C(11)-methyltransferase [Eubacterium sp.]
MVHFVGAGSGAVDLITVRGAELLKKADVIIYAGSLVNRELLSYAKKESVIYDSKDMTLPDVISVMKEAVEKGLEVVRLHTGEPSIYGAVREQMDELDKLGIEYDSCPGVTAAFGAAAALNLEYTLPDVSQSLIITRMEGRTAVPEGEDIESFAAHQASMAIYLSAGMMDKLSARLINGGYKPDTPAAIVYKATWPDEKKVVTTVAQLAEAAAENNIKNLAVVLVGDAVGHEKYDKSKLYSPDFSTEFRAADTKEKSETIICGRVVNRYPEADIFVFTDRAEALAGKIKDQMTELGNISTAVFRSHMDEVKKRLSFSFEEKRAVIFVSASGVAVRCIADFVKDKLCDSPVIVISEDGRYVIPLLSGHIGGANELASVLADRMGAFKVITTATDISGGFQLDNYAKSHQLHIADRNLIRNVAAESLADKYQEQGDSDGADKNNEQNNDRKNVDGIKISSVDDIDKYIDKMIEAGGLVPKIYYLGIGCRRNKPYGDIKTAIESFLADNKVDINKLAAIASIDIKKDEEGIRRWAGKERIPFVVFSAEELNSLGEGFSSSETVLEKVGVDNVCERAAVAAAVKFAGEGNCGESLMVKKTVFEGITLALACDRRNNRG